MVLKRIPNTSLFCISGQAVWPQFTKSGGNSRGSCGGAGRYQRRWRHRHPHQWCSGAATRKLRFKESGVPWFRPNGSQWTRNIQWQRWDNYLFFILVGSASFAQDLRMRRGDVHKSRDWKTPPTFTSITNKVDTTNRCEVFLNIIHFENMSNIKMFQTLIF